MPKLSTNKVKMIGIQCALPDNARSVQEIATPYFHQKDVEEAIKNSGARIIYESTKGKTASDLCFEAGNKLINELNWSRKEVDGLIFITQTPDYIIPATACHLQERLGLSINCMALDVNLGCSGFVYGMFLASTLIESGACKKVVVLIGSVLRNNISSKDKGTFLNLSDCGSAVAFEYQESASKTSMLMLTDGSGYKDVIIPAGGSRLPLNESTALQHDDNQGNSRSQEDLYINGLAVFSFGVRRVPSSIKEIMSLHGWNDSDVDKYFFHQPSEYLIKYLIKKVNLKEDKVPINIGDYGNTNGSTIPLLICDLYKNISLTTKQNVIMCGFGVGFSWGIVATTFEDLKYADIILV